MIKSLEGRVINLSTWLPSTHLQFAGPFAAKRPRMFALLKKESGDLQNSDGHVKINQKLMNNHPKCSELQTRELQMSELQMSAGYLYGRGRRTGRLAPSVFSSFRPPPPFQIESRVKQSNPKVCFCIFLIC